MSNTIKITDVKAGDTIDYPVTDDGFTENRTGTVSQVVDDVDGDGRPVVRVFFGDADFSTDFPAGDTVVRH
ncbi:MAG: hypothetical protein QM774_10590 [Gordonia sp. (in: high G+C Gram-positive bacteria)]|uniref:hypothetical protein n=1 Tax=Gordonia sp. (in: high G+C Gram-positive bacteria) TaxID=84139 RepID=UPI0039E65696